MPLFWVLVVVTLISFLPQYRLSYRDSKWLGLILPAVYLCFALVFVLFNLLHAFSDTAAFGMFLTAYGNIGVFALVLKIGFLFTPAAAHLVIYFIGRHKYQKMHNPVKHNREYQKMLADDL